LLLFTLLGLLSYAWVRGANKKTLRAQLFNGAISVGLIGVACWQLASWLVEALV